MCGAAGGPGAGSRERPILSSTLGCSKGPSRPRAWQSGGPGWPCWGGFGVPTTSLWRAGFRTRTLCPVCDSCVTQLAGMVGGGPAPRGESCHSVTGGCVTCHLYMLGPKNWRGR